MESVPVLLLFVATLAFAGPQSDTILLFASCSDAGELRGVMRKSDAVQVRYSLAGDSETCYSVFATVHGKVLEGYLLGAEHPAVVAFEQQARSSRKFSTSTGTGRPPATQSR